MLTRRIFVWMKPKNLMHLGRFASDAETWNRQRRSTESTKWLMKSTTKNSKRTTNPKPEWQSAKWTTTIEEDEDEFESIEEAPATLKIGLATKDPEAKKTCLRPAILSQAAFPNAQTIEPAKPEAA